MALSLNTFVEKQVGDTINITFPYLNKDHIYVVVDEVDVSSSFYSWTSPSTLEVLDGFPVGLAGQVERRTPTDELPAEQKGASTFDFKGANANDIWSLFIAQENVDKEEARNIKVDELGDDLAVYAADYDTIVGYKDQVVTLAGQVATNKAAVDVAKSAVDTAKASVDVSKTSIDASQTDVTAKASQVATNKAAVDVAKSAVDTAKASVDASQVTVLAARDAVLSAYDNFDDTYLGSFNEDPTLDNDGDPLANGMLYSNPTTGMRLYVSGNWVAAYIAADNINANNINSGTLDDGRLSFTISAYVKTLLDDADAEEFLETLGAGDTGKDSLAATSELEGRQAIGAIAVVDIPTGDDADAEAGTGTDNVLWPATALKAAAEEFGGADIYTGSSASETNFPIGHIVLVDNDQVNRNATSTLRLSGSDRYLNSGTDTVLSGTWRARGVMIVASDNGSTLFQRVA